MFDAAQNRIKTKCDQAIELIENVQSKKPSVSKIRHDETYWGKLIVMSNKHDLTIDNKISGKKN